MGGGVLEAMFSGFKLKKTAFFITEGLDLQLAMNTTFLKYPWLVLVFKQKYTPNRFKMNNVSKLIKHVREVPKNVCSSIVSFNVILKVSVSPWLSHIHYVYKVPYYSLQQFVIHPLVIFVHYYSPFNRRSVQ